MRNLSRILTVILCCAPVMSIAAGPVATTNGSNLTSYNPNNAYNNQWATISNGRYDADTTAKADFGNCNAVVLRCAQPKCSGGGCTDASVAGAIVSGCVKSNSKCKQYGDDLIEYMTAQLVANSNAKIQEQQVALEQAKIQADAQAAAAAAANSQNEQMMAQMQNQMYQMQQQMAQQQEESNRQLQEALAQQQAQSAAALESMKTAATESAQQTESGITSYQQEAINRGISTDVLERQKITGQIMTEIENADLKLKAVKTAMQNSFDYAKCDNRGNNCSAPTRIKKWRELATGFLEPYDETIDKIYDALITAQTVGVDLSQIYMMLNNSCNSWGQYLCERGGTIDYGDGKGAPKSCPKETEAQYNVMSDWCAKQAMAADKKSSDPDKYYECMREYPITHNLCKPCTLLKVLTDGAEVYEGWINPTADETSNGTVVACASNALDGATLFSRRTKNKNGAGLVDIDLLDTWLNQVEPDKNSGNNIPKPTDYCGLDYSDKSKLESKKLSRSIDTKKTNDDAFCVDWNSTKWEYSSECPYIDPMYAICDTHPYNANIKAKNYTGENAQLDTTEQEQMNEIIGLKITVISQQMYKQYEYLRATLQRLKIQLEKSVLAANLEAAGGKSDSSSSSGLLGANSNKDKTVVLAGAINCSYQVDFDRFVDCISGNVQNVIRAADGSDRKNACLQLQYDLDAANTRLVAEQENSKWTQCYVYISNGTTVNTGKTCANNDRDIIKKCANEIITKLSVAKRNINNKGKSLKDLLGG